MKQIKTVIPLSLFKKRTKEYLSIVECMEEAIILTVNGRGVFVLHHLDSFMNLKELAEYGLHQRALDSMFQRAQEP